MGVGRGPTPGLVGEPESHGWLPPPIPSVSSGSAGEKCSCGLHRSPAPRLHGLLSGLSAPANSPLVGITVHLRLRASASLVCLDSHHHRNHSQGSLTHPPTPQPRATDGTGWWPARASAAQQEVSCGLGSQASSALPITPHRSNYRLTPPTPPLLGKIVFHETCPWCQKCWGNLFSKRSL